MEINKNIANNQLLSIQSMLASGHKSIHIERHTPILWGTAIAFLIGFNFDLARPFYESSHNAGRVFTISMVAVVLFVAVLLDMKMTKAARSLRDESISIVQRRVTYSIWMFFAFSFVLDAYANTHLGGGRKMFGVYVVLGGITMSLFGMYAERWYRWCGAVMIVAGLCMMFLIDPGNTLRLAAASVFFVGGVSSSILANRAKTHWQCFGLSMLWIISAFLLLLIWLKLDYQLDITPDTQAILTMEEYQEQKTQGHVIVRLPVGTVIPVKIEVGSDIFSSNAKTTMKLKMGKQIDIEVKDGRLTGIYRVNNGKWLESNDAIYTRLFERKTILTGLGSPFLQRKMILGVDREFGGLK